MVRTTMGGRSEMAGVVGVMAVDPSYRSAPTRGCLEPVKIPSAPGSRRPARRNHRPAPFNATEARPAPLDRESTSFCERATDEDERVREPLPGGDGSDRRLWW